MSIDGGTRRVRVSCAAGVVALSWALPGCGPLADVFGGSPESHHEAYRESLEEAGFTRDPAATAWIEASRSALDDPAPGHLPHAASGWFVPSGSGAYAVQVDEPDRGWVRIRAELTGAPTGVLFVDAYRVPDDPDRPRRLLASTGDSATELSVRTPTNGGLLVRVQPELGRGGPWTLEMTHHEDEPEVDDG